MPRCKETTVPPKVSIHCVLVTNVPREEAKSEGSSTTWARAAGGKLPWISKILFGEPSRGIGRSIAGAGGRWGKSLNELQHDIQLAACSLQLDETLIRDLCEKRIWNAISQSPYDEM